jgi:hypothetical protein
MNRAVHGIDLKLTIAIWMTDEQVQGNSVQTGFVSSMLNHQLKPEPKTETSSFNHTT